MAIVQRRYKFVGPPDSQLAREVGAASQNATFPTTVVVMNVDNAAGGAEALDEFMLLQGWEQDSEASPWPLPRALLGWGNSDIGAAFDSRFLSPGHDFILASTTDTLQIPITRPGKLQNLFVRHNSAPVGGIRDATYTVMKNGVATTITATLAVGAVGQATDIVNTELIGTGDRVSLRVTKNALGVVNGAVDVQVSLECEDVI